MIRWSRSLALGSDGGIVAGGNFASVNNQTRLGAARLQADRAYPRAVRPALAASREPWKAGVSMLEVPATPGVFIGSRPPPTCAPGRPWAR